MTGLKRYFQRHELVNQSDDWVEKERKKVLILAQLGYLTWIWSEGEPPAEPLVSQGRATPGACCSAQFCLHLYWGRRSVANLTTHIWFSPNFKTEGFLVLPKSEPFNLTSRFCFRVLFLSFLTMCIYVCLHGTGAKEARGIRCSGVGVRVVVSCGNWEPNT